MRRTGWRDRGVVTPVELMFVLLFLLVGLAFIGFVGRLHGAGVEVTAASQAAARAASLAADSAMATEAARDMIDASGLAGRCSAPPRSTLTWEPSSTGTWQGGSVTVTVSCDIDQGELTGMWTPGLRTVSMSDTQPIDRYKR